MNPATLAGLALAAPCILLYLRAEHLGLRRQSLVFKPLTTILLLIVALVALPAHQPPYQLAICIGLLFSLAGDVFLMLTPARFVAGLLSFLLAHLAYVLAFVQAAPAGSAPWLLLPLGLAAALVLRLLWRALGALRVPVLLYIGAILLMVWTALARAVLHPGPASALAGGGALLFMLSDSLLALNRFRQPLRHATVWIMVSYWLAQTCIALSVGLA